MKQKLILFTVILLSAFAVRAQNNLQFNRALFVEMTYTTPSNSVPSNIQQTITVPAGKIWKIESASGNYRSPSSIIYSPTGVQISINDKLIYAGTTNTALYNYFPIWLPAGAYTLTLGFNSSVLGYTINGSISGIEFNLTQ